MTLSVDNLYNLSADTVPGAVQGAFTAELRASGSVGAMFFAASPSAEVADVASAVTITKAGVALDFDWIDSVAAALACSAISRTSLYGFSVTVNQSAADGWWQQQIAGSKGLQASGALWDWAFPSGCTDTNAPGTSFQDYLASGPASWAQQLADHVTTNAFINVDLNKLVAADPNWLQKVNLIYYKLWRLDPSQEQRVIKAFTNAYSNAVKQWPTYNHLTGTFQPDAWVGGIQAAVGVESRQTNQLPLRADGAPRVQLVTTFGQAVLDFLRGKPAALGLASGNSPTSNVTVQTLGG
jgi:hypothetical protein